MPARCFEVKSDWLLDQARRLDAAAYAEGGLAARDRIKAGPWHWCALGELATVYLPPRFTRRYVRDPFRGVPFLSSSDMLLADLSGLALLSKRAIDLDALTGVPGSTLVSRSGTIGRTAYWREEMGGMAVSEHVIHVRPRRSRILPGYLFAFLTSVPAQAMIRQHTYGSVVQHIEPHHLTDLPVPLPEVAEQRRIHELVERAAAARTEASRLVDQASGYFDSLAGSFRYAHEHALAAGIVRRSELRQTRLDAFTHTGWAAEARALLGDPLASLAEVSRPRISRRLFAERGTPFVSGIDVFQLRPEARSRLRRDEAVGSGAVIEAGQILVQRSGQRYGLLGRSSLSCEVKGVVDNSSDSRMALRYPRSTPGASRVSRFRHSPWTWPRTPTVPLSCGSRLTQTRSGPFERWRHGSADRAAGGRGAGQRAGVVGRRPASTGASRGLPPDPEPAGGTGGRAAVRVRLGGGGPARGLRGRGQGLAGAHPRRPLRVVAEQLAASQPDAGDRAQGQGAQVAAGQSRPSTRPGVGRGVV